jgi:hypothetical protein
LKEKSIPAPTRQQSRLLRKNSPPDGEEDADGESQFSDPTAVTMLSSPALTTITSTSPDGVLAASMKKTAGRVSGHHGSRSPRSTS